MYIELQISGALLPKVGNTPNLIEIRPVAAKLFHAKRRTEGRTDITNLEIWWAVHRSIIPLLITT